MTGADSQLTPRKPTKPRPKPVEHVEWWIVFVPISTGQEIAVPCDSREDAEDRGNHFRHVPYWVEKRVVRRYRVGPARRNRIVVDAVDVEVAPGGEADGKRQ
jgi:hypothetical protein